MKYEFSIIVPYWNKRHEINLVLKSLDRQDYDWRKFEVIIVDDGSPERIDDIIENYQTSMNIRYLYLQHTGNRSRNRNCGVEHSQADKIIFLDSDILIKPDFLAVFERELAADQGLVLLGTRIFMLEYDQRYITPEVIEDHFQVIESLPALNDERTDAVSYSEAIGLKNDGNWQNCHSFCIGLWKQQLLQVGGFDEDFGADWGAEDIELGYRLQQGGCRIVLSQALECYHMFHRESVGARIDSLLRNYDRFLRKHFHWSVELFCKEYETGPIEFVKLQQQIRSRAFIITEIDHLESCLEKLPARVLVCGIENQQLIDSPKVLKAFIPESRILAEKIDNIIGFNTLLAAGSFDVALISAKYRQHYGLLTLLTKEAQRISDSVIIVENSLEEAIASSEVNSPKRLTAKCLLFYLSNFIHFSYDRYYFIRLAVAARRIGIRCGLNLEYDPFGQIEVNSGYLTIAEPETKRLIGEICNQDLLLIGSQVPCIMDARMVMYSQKSSGSRILWQEMEFINQTPQFTQLLPFYQTVLLRNPSEARVYSERMNPAVLPVGVNSAAIKQFKSTPKTKKEGFVFLWSDLFTDSYSNLDVLLQAFVALFGKDERVNLRIVSTGNHLPYIANPNYNLTVNRFVAAHNTTKKTVSDVYRAELENSYGKYPNIVFKGNCFTEEEYYQELHNCDCYINLNATLRISPMVLNAVAFGKKPVVLNNQVYDGYLSADMFYRVSSLKEPGISFEPLVEQVGIYEKDPRRYYLAYRPQFESLLSTLNQIYSNREAVMIGEKQTEQFLAEYDWLIIAEKLARML